MPPICYLNFRRAVEMHVPALKVRLFRHIAKVMKKVVECQEETQGVGYDGLAVSWAPSMFNGKDPKGQTSLETKLKFAPIVAQFFKYQNEFFCSYPGWAGWRRRGAVLPEGQKVQWRIDQPALRQSDDGRWNGSKSDKLKYILCRDLCRIF